MHSMKRQVLSSRNAMVVAAAGLVLGVATFAYGGDGTSANAVRHVRGRTIFSEESPKAELSVRRGFRFIGTQQVNLYGVAEAEQYLFARSGPDKIVKRFYWIQFEHFLPTNNHTYNYDSTRTTQIGDLQFIYDVKSLPDYAAAVAGDPASDGAAMERLLAKQHLSFPHKAVHGPYVSFAVSRSPNRVNDYLRRSFAARYRCPCSEGGVQLDTESPSSAQMFLEHARQGLVVQTR